MSLWGEADRVEMCLRKGLINLQGIGAALDNQIQTVNIRLGRRDPLEDLLVRKAYLVAIRAEISERHRIIVEHLSHRAPLASFSVVCRIEA